MPSVAHDEGVDALADGVEHGAAAADLGAVAHFGRHEVDDGTGEPVALGAAVGVGGVVFKVEDGAGKPDGIGDNARNVGSVPGVGRVGKHEGGDAGLGAGVLDAGRVLAGEAGDAELVPAARDDEHGSPGGLGGAQLDVGRRREGDVEVEAPREAGHVGDGIHAEVDGRKAATAYAEHANRVDAPAHDEHAVGRAGLGHHFPQGQDARVVYAAGNAHGGEGIDQQAGQPPGDEILRIGPLPRVADAGVVRQDDQRRRAEAVDLAEHGNVELPLQVRLADGGFFPCRRGRGADVAHRSSIF